MPPRFPVAPAARVLRRPSRSVRAFWAARGAGPLSPGPQKWTLWDGFQTLQRRSNVWLNRENVILPHPDGRPRRARSGPPTRPKRATWKKRDSFQTLCSGGCLRGVVDELAHLYEEGASIDALGRRYGVHRTTIIAHLDRRGVTRRHVARKMTDPLVAQASERYAEGLSVADVASEFAVHPGTLAREFRRAATPIRAAARLESLSSP